MLVVGIFFRNEIFQHLPAEKLSRPKIKIITQASHLVINHRMVGTDSSFQFKIISKQHTCLTAFCQLHHPLQRKLPQAQSS